MNAASPSRVTFSQFANVYVLFSVIVIAAMFAAEVSPSLDLYRTFYSIWGTTVLLTPALVCFIFSGYSDRVANYWTLFWTFSYLAYLIHFYWAVFIIFDGVADSFVKQGPTISIPNYILTIWWGFDVILLWIARKPRRWIHVQRFVVHVYVFLVFAVTTLYLKDGFVRVLGVVMTVSVVVAVVARLYASSRFERSADAEPATS